MEMLIVLLARLQEYSLPLLVIRRIRQIMISFIVFLIVRSLLEAFELGRLYHVQLAGCLTNEVLHRFLFDISRTV